MYQYLLLDIDNTLLDFDVAEERGIRNVIEPYFPDGYPGLLEQYRAINTDLWRRLERGELSKEIVLNTRFAEFFKQHGIKVDGAELEKQYRRYLNESADHIPHAEETLVDLKEKGKRLYAASNGVYTTQIQRLHKAGLYALFDGLFISEKIGYEKPSRHFFDHCFSQIPGFQRDKALMIGDSVTSDIQGALNAGIDSCFYQRNSELACAEATHTIRDIREILAIVN